MIVAGAAILLNRRARLAATLVGLLMTLLTFFLYFPILTMAHGISQIGEGVNYVADTLLFGGTTLLLASALRDRDYVSEFPAR
jgi:peptidoglycan/LPS O-acetylase OafA/YrhL